MAMTAIIATKAELLPASQEAVLVCLHRLQGIETQPG